jgi:lactoylglutathione lyase
VFRDPQVNLYVADIDASLRFYRDLFGFTETFRTPKEGTPIHIELRLGHLILGLAALDSLRSVHGVESGAGPPRGEVVVWTDDLDQAFSQVTALGARPLNQPHNFIGAVRGAWVADPDGNPVQMVARLKSSG